VTASQLDGFLNVATWICLAGALLNVIRLPKRKLNAILMALAFLILAGTVFAYRNAFPPFVLGAGTVCVLGLLIADFVVRAGRPRSKS
jgi:hypothetical protein